MNGGHLAALYIDVIESDDLVLELDEALLLCPATLDELRDYQTVRVLDIVIGDQHSQKPVG